jgi:tetratricopeptide (TPR) repeat protein
MKIEHPFSFNVFTKQTNEDIKTNNQFIYFQLLIDCFHRMKCNEKDVKNELITLLERQYEDNDTQLDIIHQFQTDYSMEKVLWWYTRPSFFNKIFNKALDVQNIHLIFLFHSFISHLYSQLKQYQSKCQLQVFRSQVLSIDELNHLKQNLGQFISINSFLSANTDIAKALNVFSTFKPSTDFQSVLFAIDADPASINIKPFGLINSEAEFADESEVLFMAASIFTLNEIICDDNQLCIIKMTLCADEEYHSILDSMQIKPQDENEQTNLRTFAKILWKMNKLDLAEYYYNRLIKQLPPNDPLLMVIYDDLGMMNLQKEKFDLSIKWFTKSIEIKKQTSLIDDQSNMFIGKFTDS